MNEKVYYFTEKNVLGFINYSARVHHEKFRTLRMIIAGMSISLLMTCGAALWLNSVRNYVALSLIASYAVILLLTYLVSGYKRGFEYFQRKETEKFNEMMYQARVVGEIDSIIENIDDMFGSPK